MHRDIVTLPQLAARLDMSISWTQKHWREIVGLPKPFIGDRPHGRPRWKRADIDRFFSITTSEAPRPQALSTNPPHELFPANDAAPRSAPPLRQTRRDALRHSAGA